MNVANLGEGKRPYPLFLSPSLSGGGQQDKEAHHLSPDLFCANGHIPTHPVALLIYTRVLTTLYSSKWKGQAKITMTHKLKISLFIIMNMSICTCLSTKLGVGYFACY